MHDVHQQTTKILAKLQNANSRQKQSPKLYINDDSYYTATLPSTADIDLGLAPIIRSLPTDTNPVDPTTPATSTNNHPAVSNTIGFELWEALAYDLALNHTDLPTIARGYGVTTSQIKTLRSNPYFAKMLNAKKEEVRTLGEDATFTVQMRLLTNKAVPSFLYRLTDPSTPTKEFHTLFKTAVELAKLTPKPDADVQNNSTGTSITFNIQGIPGLDHLTPLTPSTSVIDMPDPIITDAQYSEVAKGKQDVSPDDELLEL